ncbi:MULTISPECIES: Hok/Gef family protein [unclassified Leclercia]|uniref:Hok/Gef family protein n=2 Tax=Enterobacteriaceae TaxID=543 RepID=UPI00281653C4|nr:Hok/Gef family protein [Leclercia sp. EC_58]
MHGTGSGKPRLTKNQGGGSKRHVRTRGVRYLARFKSKEASMKSTKLIIRVTTIAAITAILLTLITRRNLCEISYRKGSLEVTARLDCNSGKE